MSQDNDNKLRLSIFPHPFKSERIEKYVDPAPIQEIVDSLDLDLDICEVMVIDTDIKVLEDNWDQYPESQHLIIRTVPKGAEVWMTVLGVLAIVAGAILMITGVGAVIGGILIGTGVGLLAGGIAIAAMMDSMDAPPSQEILPSIRGSRNRARMDQRLPILFGKHLVVPDVAALPYVQIESNDQVLHQMFCAGYKDVSIVPGTTKIADTLITEYQDVTVEEQNGIGANREDLMTVYPHRQVETGIQVKVVNGEPVVRSSSSNAKTLQVIISFPSGLTGYNDESNRENRSVRVTVEYRKTGGTWEPWKDLTLTAASKQTVRYQWIKTLDNDTTIDPDWVENRIYDVRVTRVTADSDATTIVDEFYWDTLTAGTKNFDSLDDGKLLPVTNDTREHVSLIGLKIRASNQLQGVVDEFNFEGQLTARVWNGLGSGSAYWVDGDTGNNASMFLYVLQSPYINPEPLSDSDIDWPALEDWYTFCETNSFECNAQITGDYTIAQLLNYTVSGGRASWSLVDNKYTVVLDDTRTFISQHFTPRNSYGYSGMISFAKKPSTLRMQFVDASLGYVPAERLVAYNTTTGVISFDELIETDEVQEVPTYGVTSADHAAKLGAYRLACAWLRPEIHSFSVDIEYLVSTRGDRIKFTHDIPLFGLNSGRISSVVNNGPSDSGFFLDEEILYQVGENYGVTVRLEDGSSYTNDVINPATVSDIRSYEVVFDGGEPQAGNLLPGDLVMFGISGQETRDLIITKVEPGEGMSAKLTCIDYSPDIFDADQGVLPAWNPGISIHNSITNPQVIVNGSPEPGVVASDALNRAAEIAAVALTPDYYATAPGQPGPTNIPGVPTLTGEGIFRGFVIRWDQQINLRNPYQLELQVSDDDAIWYSLGFGVFNDTDWRDTLDDTTDVPETITSFTQAPTPFVLLTDLNGEDYPTGRTLYYRIRRRTLADDVSAWSTSLSLTSSVIEDGTLGYNVINANNIKAGAISADIVETAFLSATVGITIGYVSDTGGTIDDNHEGDRRVYIDGDEIIFTIYRAGVWATQNVVKLGGSLNGEFLAALQARYMMVPGATDRIGSLNIGDVIPDFNTYLFDFEAGFEDILNDSVFFTVTGMERSTLAAKWGTYGVSGLSGVTRILERSEPLEFNFQGNGWFLDFYMRRTHPASTPFSPLVIGDYGSGPIIDYTLENQVTTSPQYVYENYFLSAMIHHSGTKYVACRGNQFMTADIINGKISNFAQTAITWNSGYTQDNSFGTAVLISTGSLAVVLKNSTLKTFVISVVDFNPSTFVFTSNYLTLAKVVGTRTLGTQGQLAPLHDGDYGFSWSEYDSVTYTTWVHFSTFTLTYGAGWDGSLQGTTQVYTKDYAASGWLPYVIRSGSIRNTTGNTRQYITLTNYTLPNAAFPGLEMPAIVIDYDTSVSSTSVAITDVPDDTTGLQSLVCMDHLLIPGTDYSILFWRHDAGGIHIFLALFKTTAGVISQVDSVEYTGAHQDTLYIPSTYRHAPLVEDDIAYTTSILTVDASNNRYAVMFGGTSAIYETPKWADISIDTVNDLLVFDDDSISLFDITTVVDRTTTTSAVATIRWNVNNSEWQPFFCYTPYNSVGDVYMTEILEFTMGIASDYIKMIVDGSQTYIEMSANDVTVPWVKTVEVLGSIANQWQHWFIGWDGASSSLDIYFNNTQVLFPFSGDPISKAGMDLVFDFSNSDYDLSLDDIYLNPIDAFAGDPGDHYVVDTKWSTLFDVKKDLILLAAAGGQIGSPDALVSESTLGAPFITSLRGAQEEKDIRDAYDTGISPSGFWDWFRFANTLDTPELSGELAEDEWGRNVYTTPTYDPLVQYLGHDSMDWLCPGQIPVKPMSSNRLYYRPLYNFYNSWGNTTDNGVPADVVESYDHMVVFKLYFPDDPSEATTAGTMDSFIVSTTRIYQDEPGEPQNNISFQFTSGVGLTGTAGGLQLRHYTRGANVFTDIPDVLAAFKQGWNTIVVYLHHAIGYGTDGVHAGADMATQQYAGEYVKIIVNGVSGDHKVTGRAALNTSVVAQYSNTVYMEALGQGWDDPVLSSNPTHCAGLIWAFTRGKLWTSGYDAALLDGSAFPSEEEFRQFQLDALFTRFNKNLDVVIRPHEAGKVIIEGGVIDASKGVLIAGPVGGKGTTGDTGATGPEGPSYLDGGTWDTIYAVEDDIDGGGW